MADPRQIKSFIKRKQKNDNRKYKYKKNNIKDKLISSGFDNPANFRIPTAPAARTGGAAGGGGGGRSNSIVSGNSANRRRHYPPS